nr:wssv090 [White spot syndrome virus]AYV99256.1 wssv091 [White spot syndrome virus]WCQ76695.1 hypothetical protein WSSU-DNA_00105 [White spot syndrome virus]
MVGYSLPFLGAGVSRNACSRNSRNLMYVSGATDVSGAI